MQYDRPAFGDLTFPTQTIFTPYGNREHTLPKFDTPITPKENFRRAAKRENPLWVPNHLTDFHKREFNELASHKLGTRQGGPNFRFVAKEDYTFIDPIGNSWTWVTSAGGAMLTPGTMLLEDITEWEKVIKWQNYDEWNFEEVAQDFMKNEYNPEKVMHCNIFQGCTEMLVAVLGGYGEGMLAMAEEPEAVLDFHNAIADMIIKRYDLLKKLYPLDYVTYHDDWGTERAPFFSNAMLRELVFEPTKRIVDHIHADGVFVELHSCGNIELFMPEIVDMGFDFLQIQRRAVDIPALKEQYGDKIGFNPTFEGYVTGTSYTEEEIKAAVRKTVDLYAKGGGFYPWIFEPNSEALWTICTELYAYSREFYDKEQGR